MITTCLLVSDKIWLLSVKKTIYEAETNVENKDC